MVPLYRLNTGKPPAGQASKRPAGRVLFWPVFLPACSVFLVLFTIYYAFMLLVDNLLNTRFYGFLIDFTLWITPEVINKLLTD